MIIAKFIALALGIPAFWLTMLACSALSSALLWRRADKVGASG